MNAKEVSLFILNIEDGGLDDAIPEIETAIKLRRERQAREKFLTLGIGDRVRVNAPSLRPRYLNGATGTITEKRITKVSVRLDDDIEDPYGKWAGRTAVVPTGMLEPIDA
jgi:hypothetical protein